MLLKPVFTSVYIGVKTGYKLHEGNMWARRLNINSVSDMKRKMNEGLQNKRLSRLSKGYHDNFFTLGWDSLETFLTKLYKNLEEMPDYTRFQMAISHPTGHWWMMDCYIKDGILYTLTIDAGASEIFLDPLLLLLNKIFPAPHGKHYVLTQDENNPQCIQSTPYECWIFARDHISIVSKMDADKLYDMLQANTHPTGFDNIAKFSIGKLNDKMAMLAPLFRNMQSLERMQELYKLDSFKKSIVSKQKNLKNGEIILERNLKAWVGENTVSTPDKKRVGQTKHQNRGIFAKGNRYIQKFQQNTKSFTNDRSGFSFITLPSLIEVKNLMNLNAINFEYIKLRTADLILDLEPATKFTTKAASFLGFKGIHAEKTKTVIKQLKQLRQSDLKKAEFVDILCEILFAYAGYLDKHNSVRTMMLLKNTIAKQKAALTTHYEQLPHDLDDEFEESKRLTEKFSHSPKFSMTS